MKDNHPILWIFVVVGNPEMNKPSKSNKLQAVTIKYFRSNVCQAMYPNRNITKKMLCAGLSPQEAQSKKGICNGDIGGPLVCNNKLFGIASFNSDDCGSKYVDVYCRVQNILAWIHEITNIDPK